MDKPTPRTDGYLRQRKPALQQRAAYWRNQYFNLADFARELERERNELEQTVARLRAALESVFLLLDSGWLVRNTADDVAPDWAWRQLNCVRKLAEARAALKSKET